MLERHPCSEPADATRGKLFLCTGFSLVILNEAKNPRVRTRSVLDPADSSLRSE
jgi:hypothetical protein